MSDPKDTAAATLLRLAGRDHHDAGAIQHARQLATHRKRLFAAAEARLKAERDDLLRAMNDLVGSKS
jgi:hypothetical protein